MRRKVGVLIVRAAQKTDADGTGLAVEAALRELGFDEIEQRFCATDEAAIQTHLLDLCDWCALIFTIGGTGFGRRDITPQATQGLIERQADSISELIRLSGLQESPFAYLSRGISGIRGNTLIVNLPGSSVEATCGIRALSHLMEPIMAALSSDESAVAPEPADRIDQDEGA